MTNKGIKDKIVIGAKRTYHTRIKKEVRLVCPTVPFDNSIELYELMNIEIDK